MRMSGINDWKLIEFKKIEDKRGCLSVIEECKEIPFRIGDVRWISCHNSIGRIPLSFQMGKEKFIVPLSGEFDITDSDGIFKNIRLDKPNQGLYLNGDISLEIVNFSKDSVALIMSSESR